MKVKELIENSVWMPGNDYDLKKPKVSILMPTYCRGRDGLFRLSVNSLLSQTYQDIELLVVDDCSVDGTFDQIKKFMEQDGRVSCIRHPNNIGLPAISEFEAFQKAKGDYIFFGFDDNQYELDAIESLLNFAENNGFAIVRGDGKMALANGEKILFSNRYISTLISANFILNSSVLLHRKVFEEIGLYDPHIHLVRLCDYDLWRRVIMKYDFPHLPKLITTEHGVSRKDSLGNTRFLETWSIYEYMATDRNESLLPKNFENYEIDSISVNLTDRTKAIIEKENKDHFSKKQIEFEAMEGKETVAKDVNTQKTIVILANGAITASVLHFFDNLSDEIKPRIMYILADIWSCQINVLANVSCLIVVRDIEVPIINLWVKAAYALKIPVYLFVDDNFVELGNFSFEEYREKLASLTGILASTLPLQQYFLNTKLHDNVKLFPMSIKKYLDKRVEFHQKKDIKIAFLGGLFREEPLEMYVIPAIRKLGKDYNVTLFLPKTISKQNSEKIIDSFNTQKGKEQKNRNWVKVITRQLGRESYGEKGNGIDRSISIRFYERDLSFYPVIRYLQEQQIDILVYPIEYNANNNYKTLNNLVCACMIGAALIGSDDEPYKNVQENLLIKVENTVDSWYQGLVKLTDAAVREELYNNAFEYCQKNYDGRENKKVIDEILASSPYVDSLKEMARNPLLLNFYVQYDDEINPDRWKNFVTMGGLIKEIFRRITQKNVLQMIKYFLSKLISYTKTIIH